jgi:histidine triad (HIT) family protein
MPDCLFCKILAKEIPSSIVFEDDEVMAFKDKFPKAPTHILFVPKAHIDSIQTLDKSTKDITSMLIWKAKQFAEEKGIRGYKLTFHVGREGGQEIFHLHLHLMSNQILDSHDPSANIASCPRLLF